MEGRVIAITGGAGGIGLATAKVLASRGAKLSLADVSEGNLESAKKEIHQAVPSVHEVLICKCDVRDLSQVEKWIKQTVDKYGKLDGACNLAGVTGDRPFTYAMDEEDEDTWDLIIGVNLTGVMHCIKTEVKFMNAGASSMHFAHRDPTITARLNLEVVNAASVAGLRGTPKLAAYTASKHGVVGLTKCAAKDFGSRGIRVNAIAPGYIRSPMTDHAEKVVGPEFGQMVAGMSSLGREGKAEEVGTLICFLLSDDASYVTGAVYEVDAGFTA